MPVGKGPRGVGEGSPDRGRKATPATGAPADRHVSPAAGVPAHRHVSPAAGVSPARSPSPAQYAHRVQYGPFAHSTFHEVMYFIITIAFIVLTQCSDLIEGETIVGGHPH